MWRCQMVCMHVGFEEMGHTVSLFLDKGGISSVDFAQTFVAYHSWVTYN